MITHEIRKNKPNRLFAWNQRRHQPSEDAAFKAVQKIKDDSRVIENDHEGGSGRRVVPISAGMTLIPSKDRPVWLELVGDKHGFNKFVNETREKFHMGDLVTLAMYPYIPGVLPHTYRVYEFIEMRTIAAWDALVQEPRVVGIIPTNSNQVTKHFFMAPSRVRLLTDEEKHLADLQDQKASAKKDTPAIDLESGDRADRAG